MVEVVVTNLPAIWQMAIDATELQIIRLVETVKHAFTVAIPEYANWFGRNFTNIGRDIFVGYVTMVQNMATKVGNILQTLWEFIKSGGAGGFKELFANIVDDVSGSLLEGFEAKTESLPDIMARSITDREAELQGKIAKVGADLGQQFSDKYNSRMKGLGKSTAEELKTTLAQGTAAADEKLGALKSASSLTATESRLQTRGKADQGIDKIAKNTENANKILADISKKVEPPPSNSSSGMSVELVA